MWWCLQPAGIIIQRYCELKNKGCRNQKAVFPYARNYKMFRPFHTWLFVIYTVYCN